MKKDLKTLNKSVAIAIAAAMTATSAPTPLLASDFTDGGDFVSESPAAEADITEEAAVEADGFGDEAAVAAVTEDGFGDSEAVADAAAGQMKLQAVKTSDGNSWWAVFTSFDEELKGGGSVMSTFMTDIGKVLEAALSEEEINGVIINPWNRTLMLDKTLIRIVLGDVTQ